MIGRRSLAGLRGCLLDLVGLIQPVLLALQSGAHPRQLTGVGSRPTLADRIGLLRRLFLLLVRLNLLGVLKLVVIDLPRLQEVHRGTPYATGVAFLAIFTGTAGEGWDTV